MAKELSCLRCHRHPRDIAEVRRPRLCEGKRSNSELISSTIESLIYGRTWQATRLDRVGDRQHLQGNTISNSEDIPPPAVGAYWINHPALQQLFDDGDKMPPSWKERLTMAEEMEQGLKAYGHVVLRVYTDPATFPDWCAAHGMSSGSAGRRKFVAATVTERYGGQT